LIHVRRLGFALVIAVLMSSCAHSTQRYGASKTEGVYFTVPSSWHEITMASLNSFETKSTSATALEKLAYVKWQEAYSPDNQVGPKETFSLVPTALPLAFVRVRDLFPDEINALSYNTLRDIVQPLTDWVNNPTVKTPIYNIIDDHEVVQKGGRGVRTIYNFTQSGVSQTIDQTALMSPDHAKIYVLVLRCTTTCYNKHIKEISRIADSFTVRGAK
jgi:hypothetical protein